MTTWFTADPHLGHANIIKYAKRPFDGVQQMDSTIINLWNYRVSPGDTVYVLGDFAFAGHDLYLGYLNGDKHLVLGNHDHSNRVKAATGWASISHYKEVRVEGEAVPVVCFHYSMRVWNRSHHGAIHLYGHSHGGLPGDSQSCDVGMDCWDFRPVSLSEIKVRLATLPKRGGEPDHHGNSKV
jgi:calcineurin-like phosphoesterase family protein